MATRTIYLYSTPEDYYSYLERMEKARDYRYILIGLFDTPIPQEYTSFRQIPELGISRSGSSIGGNCYLVSDAGSKPVANIITRGRFDKPLYEVNTVNSHVAVRFTPGGIFGQKYVVEGSISAAFIEGTEQGVETLRLFNQLARSVREHFTHIKHAWLGPEAFRLFQMGSCLTQDASLPLDYCLTAEHN